MSVTTRDTHEKSDRAILVGVDTQIQTRELSLDDSLAELELLAQTANVEVVGILTQKLTTPNGRTYIGSGKVDELKILSDDSSANLVIFDDELSPRHQRELEEILGNNIIVLDRTALILDIFAIHAHSREGQLQVRLAQYEYRLPRLTRAWTHLARQSGGGGGRTGSSGGVGLRGPGETQLEVDRREIRRQITKIKEELEKVREQRSRYRSQRKKSQVPVVALVGYTNAGKSTLLNRLSGSDVYVADLLFATLDPTTRKVTLDNGQSVLFTDTVGFIQNLPTQLVAAFRATLEEIAEADILVHVVDITHPNARQQANSVLKTLEEIGAGDIPIVTALNKIDLLTDPDSALLTMKSFPNTFAISAREDAGITELISALEHTLLETYKGVSVLLPFQEGQLLSLMHEHGHVSNVMHTENGIELEGFIPAELYEQFEPYIVRKTKRPKP